MKDTSRYRAVRIILFCLFATIIDIVLEQPHSYAKEKIANDVTFAVDVAKSMGPVSPLYTSGMFIARAEAGYAMDKYLRDQKAGTHELGIMSEFQYDKTIKNIDDLKNKLYTSESTKWAVKIREKGGEVVILLGLTPLWLSSCPQSPKPEICPPKSYDTWADLVRTVVDFYNNKLKLDARYVVWDEPDGYWKGSENEYLKLYRYSVLGAKRADRNAKIGGPAVSGFSEKSKENKRLWMENFIENCSRTGLTEFGMTRLPIDFLIWHNFGPIPYTASLQMAGEDARRFLEKYGYRAGTDFILGSWNSWLEYQPAPASSERSKERDTEFLSSYVLPALMEMEDAGIKRQIFFDLFGTWDKNKNLPEFSGTFGLFTEHHVIKPVYNAFKVLGMLGSNRIDVTIEDPFVRAIATSDAGKTVLIIANYIPEDRMIPQTIIGSLRKRGYTKKDLGSIDKKTAMNIIAGKGSVNDLAISPAMKKDLDQLLTYFDKRVIAERRERPMKATVDIKGLLADGGYTFERYVIDANHSNGFSIRDKIDAALKDVKRDSMKDAESYLAKRGFTKAEIDKGKDAYRRNRYIEMSEGLPADKKNELVKAQHVLKDSFDKRIADMNEWPEIKLQKTEEGAIAAGARVKKNLLLTPYSVNVIVLSAAQQAGSVAH